MKTIVKLIPPILILSSFVLAYIASPYVPYLMASHWDSTGQVNGYMSKTSGLFFMPVLSLVLYILFLFLPSLEPYKKNFKQFQNYFDNFMVAVFGFLIYIYLLTLAWNIGYRFVFFQYLSPAFAVLFYFTGVLTGNTKMNWFVGIRTPWTMSSPVVWKKTHQVGSVLFKLTAVSSLFGVVFPGQAIYLLLFPIIFTVIFVFVYSYILYSRYNQA